MASLLSNSKRLISFRLSLFSHHRNQYLALLPDLRHAHLSTKSHHEEEEMPFIAQYLVSSFRFSPDRALKVSKNLTEIKTPDQPDSVVSFLEEIGLTHSRIREIVAFRPIILRHSVQNTIKPKLDALVVAGFGGEILLQLIRSNPQCAYYNGTLPSLRFWRDFVGNSEDTLLRVIRKNTFLMQCKIYTHTIPRINLLKEYGLSDKEIVRLVCTVRGLLTKKLDSLRWVLKQIEELGILRESNMFFSVLLAIGAFKKDTLEKKVAFFKNMYGWSREEISCAFKKGPRIFTLSEENIKSKMDFLVKKAALEPRSIASDCRLLSCSVERVLLPRYKVLSALQANGLKKKCRFLSMCVVSEKMFLESFVVPYEKDFPDIREAYIAAFGEKKASV